MIATVLAIISILIGITALSLAVNNSVKRKKERFITSEVLTEKIDKGAAYLSTIDLLSTFDSAINDANGPLLTYTARPGMIVMWYTDVAPPGWVMCDGGTYNGMKTPDLRGRCPVGVFTDTPSGTNYITIEHNQTLGNRSQSVKLSENHLPPHNHQLRLEEMKQSGSATNCLVAPRPKTNGYPNYYEDGTPFYTSNNGAIYTHDYKGAIKQEDVVIDTLSPCVGVYFIMKI